MRYEFVLFVGLMLGACGGDDDSDAGGAGTSDSGTALEARCETFNKAYVATAVRCRMVYQGETVDQARGAELVTEAVPDCTAAPGAIGDASDADFANMVKATKAMACVDFCARVNEGCAA